METLSLIGNAFAGMMNPMSILLLIVGVAVGIVFGSIPGLSAAMAVALFLPVTFAMQAHEAFTLLVALYIGGISGGLIPAILINIPGTSSSIATCFDGSPMAKKGEAGKALGTGVVFSFLGGLGSPAYAAMKHGLAGLTKAYADELGKYNIQVNGLAPGYFATNITTATRSNPETNKKVLDHIPAERWGERQDLMGTCVFLASKASEYVNGTLVVVDGGYLVR